MSLWTRGVISLLLLLQTVQAQRNRRTTITYRYVIEEEKAKPSESLPLPLVYTKKDWDLTQAYFDVFKILSDQNTCSGFYGGPRVATTVLNSLVMLVEARPLVARFHSRCWADRV